MLVRNWMSKDVITVNINESLIDAIKLLKHNDIGRLPVMKKDEMVGIVTDRDVKRASASDAVSLEIHELLYLLSKIKIEEIMSEDPITVPPDYTVEETAGVLLENKISGTPVVDDQVQVVGIITQNDLFRALISLTGERKKGIQFAFKAEDRPGSIKELADIIRNYNGRLVSILSSYKNAPEGYHNVYIKAYQIDPEKISQIKKELREKATMLYFLDQRENKREVY
ncbi:MAG: CBS domain-containing protein [Deltaproteobacteria bacterium]|nr:CBS domain-containing protein [Deltaproteobacteria bacterium]